MSPEGVRKRFVTSRNSIAGELLLAIGGFAASSETICAIAPSSSRSCLASSPGSADGATQMPQSHGCGRSFAFGALTAFAPFGPFCSFCSRRPALESLRARVAEAVTAPAVVDADPAPAAVDHPADRRDRL